MDARTKAVFSLTCIITCISVKNPAVPIAIGGISLVLLFVSGENYKRILLRLAEPVFFSFTIVLLKAISIDRFPHLGINPSAVPEAVLIVSRVLGASLAALFLTMTTPAYKLIEAAAWLRMPRALVELSLITYRYLFVLMEDMLTVYQAQKVRLGYSGAGVSIRSLGTLCGAVFVRAYSRAEAAADSMELRGYEG